MKAHQKNILKADENRSLIFQIELMEIKKALEATRKWHDRY